MSTPSTKETPEVITTLDVREVAHAQRHPLIFKTYEQLQPGQAFILVVDHDPKPVLYELDFIQHGIFKWTYLEQGPEVWRVQLEKARKKEA
ncbi:MAG: DUF2249 domain-containing protein [Acidobacteria bacterium]|nr:MAG: DUF2249 domain-containing protein [Acidobacteriota bacterium]